MILARQGDSLRCQRVNDFPMGFLSWSLYLQVWKYPLASTISRSKYVWLFLWGYLKESVNAKKTAFIKTTENSYFERSATHRQRNTGTRDLSTDTKIVSDNMDNIWKILVLIRNINGIPSGVCKHFRIHF